MASVSESPPTIVGLHHFKIPVSSLERSLEFYTAVLGATYIPEYDHVDRSGKLYGHIVRFTPTPSGPAIILELRLNPSQAEKQRGSNPITFSVRAEADIDEWVTWCDAKKVENSGKLRGLIGYMLAMEDPDGIHIRMYSLEKPDGAMDPAMVSNDPKWID